MSYCPNCMVTKGLGRGAGQALGVGGGAQALGAKGRDWARGRTRGVTYTEAMNRPQNSP